MGDERVVGVGDERAVAKAAKGGEPTRGEPVDLAVAVELVAEEIGEHDRPWRAEPGDRRWHDRFVDFEQRESRKRATGEGRGDA